VSRSAPVTHQYGSSFGAQTRARCRSRGYPAMAVLQQTAVDGRGQMIVDLAQPSHVLETRDTYARVSILTSMRRDSRSPGR
jgi:hypothetical protein